MKGKVTLVGAGPGAAGLLTCKGAQAISQAQVVLADRLVGPGVLALIPPAAQVIDVGKESGNHKVPQRDINRLLLQYAQQGKRVVRLKGGDPYLFGRGAEELEEIIQAGIAFEVIPGVSSALAVPAYGGIPVTHRDYSSSVHVMTGHAKASSDTGINYESLVKLGGTLVFMMGFSAMEEILNGLIDAGMPQDMPAALVAQGTLPEQQKLVATVATLPLAAKESGMTAPAVLVVGKVCSLSDKLDWISRQPLAGRTVLVTRPQTAGSALGDKLTALGCGVISFPCIHLEERQYALPGNLEDYRWIVFTSTFGVQVFCRQMQKHGKDMRSLAHLKFAAIGGRTAQELAQRGILADYMPEIYDAVHLAQGLAMQIAPGEKALLFRAAKGTPELAEMLAQSGVSFEDVAAYDTHYRNAASPQITEKLTQGEIDYVTFTSASTVEGFVRTVGEAQACSESFTGVCIGRQTARVAQRYGIKTIVSDEATTSSMVHAILEQEETSQ